MTENPSHKLVEEAFELARSKLEQDEISNDDLREVADAFDEAIDHPESDIWVTITTAGNASRCRDPLPESDVNPNLYGSKRSVLEKILADDGTRVTVS